MKPLKAIDCLLWSWGCIPLQFIFSISHIFTNILLCISQAWYYSRWQLVVVITYIPVLGNFNSQYIFHSPVTGSRWKRWISIGNTDMHGQIWCLVQMIPSAYEYIILHQSECHLHATQSTLLSLINWCFIYFADTNTL